MQEKENEEYLEDLSKQQTAESERIVKKELEE